MSHHKKNYNIRDPGSNRGPLHQITHILFPIIVMTLDWTIILLKGAWFDSHEQHRKITTCRDPGSNRGPLDLQSNALPTELSRQTSHLNFLSIKFL